jgi:hypothetical protein
VASDIVSPVHRADVEQNHYIDIHAAGSGESGSVARLSDEGVEDMKLIVIALTVFWYLWFVRRIGVASRRRKQKLLDKIRCTKRVYHRTEDGTAFEEE